MNKLIILAVIFFSLSIISCSPTEGKDTKEKVLKLGDNSNIADGEYVSRHKNGKIYKTARYKNKKLDGVQEVYNKRGKLQNTINYVDGKREGESVVYHDNGQAYRITPYRDDKINGERKKFRRDGKLWSTQNFHQSLPENNLKEYTESGKLKSRPKFVINQIDNLKIDGSYRINLSVKGSYKKVKFFEGKLKDGKYFSKLDAFPVSNQKKNRASISIHLLPGHFMMKKYDFIAKITTHANNSIYIHRQVNIAIEN
ncbi:MAG: hypothetical protein ABFR62_07735 [Bacteroidota bacterium]